MERRNPQIKPAAASSTGRGVLEGPNSLELAIAGWPTLRAGGTRRTRALVQGRDGEELHGRVVVQGPGEHGLQARNGPPRSSGVGVGRTRDRRASCRAVPARDASSVRVVAKTGFTSYYQSNLCRVRHGADCNPHLPDMACCRLDCIYGEHLQAAADAVLWP